MLSHRLKRKSVVLSRGPPTWKEKELPSVKLKSPATARRVKKLKFRIFAARMVPPMDVERPLRKQAKTSKRRLNLPTRLPRRSTPRKTDMIMMRWRKKEKNTNMNMPMFSP